MDRLSLHFFLKYSPILDTSHVVASLYKDVL